MVTFNSSFHGFSVFGFMPSWLQTSIQTGKVLWLWVYGFCYALEGCVGPAIGCTVHGLGFEDEVANPEVQTV